MKFEVSEKSQKSRLKTEWDDRSKYSLVCNALHIEYGYARFWLGIVHVKVKNKYSKLDKITKKKNKMKIFGCFEVYYERIAKLCTVLCFE